MHKDVKADLLERVAHHATQWNVGDPLDPETHMGALVSEGHYNKACGYLDQAETVVIGGKANKGFDEVIKIANDTEYGLCASIFTANAIRGARAIRAGTVTVNCFGKGDISVPFDGYKQSGFGGRDNSVHAHDQYIQLKTIWIDLADDADEAVE